ncbi:hypothetical protein V5O48_014544 [Marasmius crinis-equi]|uniref:Endoplasmic reticulum transmembrane protein n=1 Tax=Marasmius crinis-equi TaxID=585013 RepID=A0ABR3EX04_9AGAR
MSPPPSPFYIITCVIVLVPECVALALLLFPLPKVVWNRIHHYAFIDERKPVESIKKALLAALVLSNLYALIICLVAVIRLIAAGDWWDLREARSDFFLSGATCLISIALVRTLYIVLGYLRLQEKLIEVRGKESEAQPMGLSCEYLYERRSLQAVWDAFYSLRESLGLAAHIRLPSYYTSEGSFRGNDITRLEGELAELRTALAQRLAPPAATGSDNTVGPSTSLPIPGSDVRELITNQEQEIAELKGLVRDISQKLKVSIANEGRDKGE